MRLIFRSKDKNDRKDAERLAKSLYLSEALRAGPLVLLGIEEVDLFVHVPVIADPEAYPR